MRIIKFLVMWVILLLAMVFGKWLGDTGFAFIVEHIGILNFLYILIMVALFLVMALVAWNLTED